MRAALFCAALVWPMAGHSDPAKVALLDAQFGSWLEADDANGVLAIFKDGDLVGHSEHGVFAGTQVEMASLSKAITALCAAELVAAKRLSWDRSFESYVPGGPDVEIASLATHSGGILPDGTQLALPLWLDQPQARGHDVLELIKIRRGQSGTPGDYAYNNENYALLGLTIETTAGKPYAETCQELVMQPAGVQGKLSKRTGAFASWADGR